MANERVPETDNARYGTHLAVNVYRVGWTGCLEVHCIELYSINYCGQVHVHGRLGYMMGDVQISAVKWGLWTSLPIPGIFYALMFL